MIDFTDAVIESINESRTDLNNKTMITFLPTIKPVSAKVTLFNKEYEVEEYVFSLSNGWFCVVYKQKDVENAPYTVFFKDTEGQQFNICFNVLGISCISKHMVEDLINIFESLVASYYDPTQYEEIICGKSHPVEKLKIQDLREDFLNRLNETQRKHNAPHGGFI